MRLADFIESRLDEILSEWEAFAATRLPSAAKMDALALRDHAPQILRAIAADLRELQSEADQSAKSHGLAVVVQGAPNTAAEVHGAVRAQDGFSMTQLLSEYRALRASVLRLWAKADETLSQATAADDVLRFNEAVDQAIAESVEFFSEELVRARTEREAVDRALTLNRARLEYASRLSPVGFWYCDLPFDVLDWDERVKEHFFLEPAAQVTMAEFYERIHPEDRESTRSAIAASIGDRIPYDIVYRTRHPATAEVKWIRALGGTDYASDGTPIHFDGITVDVSAQKLEENRVAESEARHRGVLANMGEAFTLFDQDFNIVEVNDSACRLAGRARSELLGANHWQRFPGTHDSELGRMYRQVLLDGRPRSIEHRYAFAEGRPCWFEVSAFVVERRVAVLFRDVTEKRELIEALKEADRRKDEFLATLAHELRNPLAPVCTALRLLRVPDLAGMSVERLYQMLDRQVGHMVRLIDDLMDASRISRGTLELQRETVALNQVLKGAVEASRPLIDRASHELSLVMPDDDLCVDGDEVRLVQVFTNLLNNAAKYTDKGGHIELAARRDGEQVTVSVRDTGIGVAIDEQARLFQMFTQLDRGGVRAQGGLGIGLSLVQRLVQMHGGQVDVASEGPGQGSTFTVRLPIMQAPATTQQRSKASRHVP